MFAIPATKFKKMYTYGHLLPIVAYSSHNVFD